MTTAANDTGANTLSPPMPTTDRNVLLPIRRLVATNARRWRGVVVCEALGLALAVPVAYFLLFVLLDQQLHLPVWGRLIASLGLLTLVVGLVGRLFVRWRALRLTEDQVALAIERR